MLFADVVDTSRRIASTSKRLEKTGLLAQLMKRLAPEEIDVAVAFLSGAARQGRIGVGYATVREAMQPPAAEPMLAIADVDHSLSELAAVQGRGSEQRKRELLSALLNRATEPEQKFLVGLLMGEIRQGALEGIMLDAIAKASGVAPDRIRRAAMMAGGVARIARPALERGETGLTDFDIQLFRPVQPMLAQSAEDVNEALGELGNAALEYKLDGARIQVHKSGDQVAVYSRAMNDVSAAIPEVVSAVRALPARDLILDGEVLSFDTNGRPYPFQVSMRRFGRKLDVNSLLNELPMKPYWFDVLYHDRPVIDEPQQRRFDDLAGVVPVSNLIPHLITASPEQADEFLRTALDAGHEGIMAKSPEAAYAAGARGQSWLKIKQPRTLDLVILAAEWGNGRRQGWLSNLHLGARDTVKGGFAMLGKTFKGLTDEMLAWQTSEFQKIEIARDKYTVYLEPKIVAEIAFNEIQISPRYVSGLALRFARVKRYRPDKIAEEADTFETVQRLAGIASS
ncbi:MAG: ATP-dependent DNA ligase [Acidobacteriaceae bacterium]|nr:ATP-dependent DNA ligase [Acidobacteriaceae bacterium]